MKIVFSKSGETIGVGRHDKGEEREVPDDVAGVLIKRGVAAVADVFEGAAVRAGDGRSEEYGESSALSCEEERGNGGE